MGLKKREQGSRDAAQALEQQLRQAQSEAEAAAQRAQQDSSARIAALQVHRLRLNPSRC